MNWDIHIITTNSTRKWKKIYPENNFTELKILEYKVPEYNMTEFKKQEILYSKSKCKKKKTKNLDWYKFAGYSQTIKYLLFI